LGSFGVRPAQTGKGTSGNNAKEINVSDQKPFTYQFIIERWADGLKVLGAGNGAGLLASGASLQFFTATPEILRSIKLGAFFFLIGILLFAVAFLILTILPLVIERFLASSDKTYGTFIDMIKDMNSANKTVSSIYLILALSSVFSVLCFFIGCLSGVLKVVLFELFRS